MAIPLVPVVVVVGAAVGTAFGVRRRRLRRQRAEMAPVLGAGGGGGGKPLEMTGGAYDSPSVGSGGGGSWAPDTTVVPPPSARSSTSAALNGTDTNWDTLGRRATTSGPTGSAGSTGVWALFDWLND